MGVQSFQFPVDFLNNLEKPIIYIANKHKEVLDSVSVYDNLSLTCNLNAFQTVSFKIYRDVDGKKQDYFKLFEEEMLIMIPGISWYEIHVETNIEPTGISKSITGNSLECKLCDKRLVDFQVNSDDFEDDDYVITKFYNPTEPKKSLLNRVLSVSPSWTVGHVDQSLWNIQRTFDESDVDVYSFLTETATEAFNCLFTFDTFNQTVNAYDLDNYGKDTDIFVSMDNLAQNMTQTIDENSIFTCYRVTGGDDIQIAEVNPNGTNKIYNFEYYLPYMPTDLQTKVKQYEAKYQNLKPKYEDIIKRLGEQIAIIQELNTRYPDSLASKDWTLYGLYGLETHKKSYETQDQLFCAQGMNKPQSLNYNLYQKNLEDLNAVKEEYNKRLIEIDDATAIYKDILTEMQTLQSELDMNKWFTEKEWKILDSYVIEQTYSNDNFGSVDNTTETELFDMEKELYNKAWEDLSKKCRPQYQYSSTLSNILTIPEFKEFIPYFELGNFIHMETDYNTIIKLRIISFTVDYTNTQTIAVTFSDAIRVKDIYSDGASIQAQATSAAMSFQFNKSQYDKTVRQGNFVAQMRKYGLDVATTAIHNSSKQSQVWDETGMTFRQWNDQSQRYDPEQIKIINNQILFSDDGFDTVRMALGKIAVGNNEFAYGINSECLISKLVMSENLWIENDSGTYKFDDNGFIASNNTNTIKIQPNNSEELFSIYKGKDKKLFINSDGDLSFCGDLTGATGTFSGKIAGGEIDIGNGVFTVDKNGNMYASSGTFSGELRGATGTFSGSLSAATGTFSGSLQAATGTFSGALNAATGTFSGDLFGNNISGSTITASEISGTTITGGDIIGGTITGGTISGTSFYSEGYDNGLTKMLLSDGVAVFTGDDSGSSTLRISRAAIRIMGGGVYDDDANTLIRHNSVKATYGNFKYLNVNGSTFDLSNYVTKSYLNNFATKSDLNNYSREGHTHSQYVTTSYLASELKQTRQWVLNNFKKI